MKWIHNFFDKLKWEIKNNGGDCDNFDHLFILVIVAVVFLSLVAATLNGDIKF
jgi:hypothetical protein